MPSFHFLCMYCGHKFEAFKYSKQDVEDTKCPICTDSSLKVSQVNLDKQDIFGYDNPDPNQEALYKK